MLLRGKISVPHKYNLKIQEAVYLVILHKDVAAVGTHTNECIRNSDMRYWSVGNETHN